MKDLAFYFKGLFIILALLVNSVPANALVCVASPENYLGIDWVSISGSALTIHYPNRSEKGATIKVIVRKGKYIWDSPEGQRVNPDIIVYRNAGSLSFKRCPQRFLVATHLDFSYDLSDGTGGLELCDAGVRLQCR